MRLSRILFISFFFVCSAIASEGSSNLRIFNALSYPVRIGNDWSSNAILKTIEPGKEILSTKHYDYLYIERDIAGADPWTFNLRVQSFVCTKPFVLVITKEGLYVVPADKFHEPGDHEIENIKANAIGRVLPMD